MLPFKSKALAARLRLTPWEKKIDKIVENLLRTPNRGQPPLEGDRCNLSVAPYRLRPYANLKEFVLDLDDYVRAAAESGSHLIAFPSYLSLGLLTLLPEGLFHWEELLSLQEEPESFLEYAEALCAATEDFVSDILFYTASALAHHHRIFIASGGSYQHDRENIYRRQYLFDDMGEPVITQDALFLSPLERMAGITAGENLVVAQTPLGKLAIVDGGALPHAAAFLVAVKKGCNIILTDAVTAVQQPMRCRAEQFACTILCPGIQNPEKLFSLPAATAAIYAPRALTRDKSGIAAQYTDEMAVVTAKVDLSRSVQSYDGYTADENPRFLETLLTAESQNAAL